MNRPLLISLIALVAVAGVAWVTTALLPLLGLASSALLFLLPVLWAATRGGLMPGLLAALAGAGAYNFFLLEPRYTFRVHQADNLVSVFVLGAVALVTSRLATRLKAREAEALDRAAASADLADLAALLASGPADTALQAGLGWLSQRCGATLLLGARTLPEGHAGFSSLDLSAAAWAQHNGDITGHGTPIMAAADWTFVPVAPKNRQNAPVAAVARPAAGTSRTEGELAQLAGLALLIGQCLDRVELDAAHRERERLEESERLRRTLLASLAHDFRTPLTVVAGRLEPLAAHNADAAEALSAARRLDRTMTDLLGIARIEGGQLAPKLETIDLVDMVGAACSGLPSPPQVSLTRRIPVDLPFVLAEPVMLQQMIANLADNAFRHALSEVVIAASVAGERVLLSVSDDGPGIPEDRREAVFDRFVRLAGSDRSSGSGLGLAIVRGFADAMGMTVALGASPSGGSCFTLAMAAVALPEEPEA